MAAVDNSYTWDSPSMSSTHSPMINYRKDAKKAIKFTFMVVGESGTGKTTFINCLLNKKVLSHRFEVEDGSAVGDTKTLAFSSVKSENLPSTSILTKNDFNPETANEEPGIALTETKVEMVDDSSQRLLLSIIDAPGFGENLNNELCFVELENYLKQQFDLVLAEETRIRRNPRFVDTRVHVLLYFITPTGHGLREIDIGCMKRLSKYVNIIPVIGRADSFTEKELKQFKHQIKVDIEKFNVPIFQFDNYLDEYDEQEDYDLIEECKFLAKLQPFAVVTSEDTYEVKDQKTGEIKTIRARQYPWGLIDVNNPKYSDFPILKSVILGSHLQDLKDLTHDFLYESYRTERLSKVTGNADENYDESYDTEKGSGTGKETKNIANGVPSLSNLAQLTKQDTTNSETAESMSVSSQSSKPKKSMLLDEGIEEDVESNSNHDGYNIINNSSINAGGLSEDLISSPKVPDEESLTSSNPSLEYDSNLTTNQKSFKRMSIGPQRDQLRKISETVPYVLRHERILERQQKLEELEMASAKELAARAALLEQKAQALKAKEKLLLRKLEEERKKHEDASAIRAASQIHKDGHIHQDEVDHRDESILEPERELVDDDQEAEEVHMKKDETLTDFHSTAN